MSKLIFGADDKWIFGADDDMIIGIKRKDT